MSTEPLAADSGRQAVAAMLGYRYQILRSVHEWLTLTEGDVLFLEVAEDFDRVSATEGTATQVKNVESGSTLTLRNVAAVSAINSCWSLIAQNPGRRIQFDFLTTAQAGIEQGAPFGSGRPGVFVWNSAAHGNGPNKDDDANSLRSFLISEGRVAQAILDFLDTASPAKVRQALLSHLAWRTGEANLESVEAAVLRKITGVCWERRVPTGYAERIKDRLEREVWATATKANDRALRIDDFYRAFEEVTTVTVPGTSFEGMLAVMSAAQQLTMRSFGSADSYVSVTSDQARGKAPPLLGRRIARRQLQGLVKDALQRSNVAFVSGASGTGKTTQAAQFAQDEASSCYWVTLRELDERQVRTVLEDAGHRIDADVRYKYLIVDDVDGLAHARAIEEHIPGLLYSLMERGGGIVLTCDRPPSQRTSSVLNLRHESVLAVEPFSQWDQVCGS